MLSSRHITVHRQTPTPTVSELRACCSRLLLLLLQENGEEKLGDEINAFDVDNDHDDDEDGEDGS